MEKSARMQSPTFHFPVSASLGRTSPLSGPSRSSRWPVAKAPRKVTANTKVFIILGRCNKSSSGKSQGEISGFQAREAFLFVCGDKFL